MHYQQLYIMKYGITGKNHYKLFGESVIWNQHLLKDLTLKEY